MAAGCLLIPGNGHLLSSFRELSVSLSELIMLVMLSSVQFGLFPETVNVKIA